MAIFGGTATGDMPKRAYQADAKCVKVSNINLLLYRFQHPRHLPYSSAVSHKVHCYNSVASGRYKITMVDAQILS
jgi:hypothetical protein